jgi:P27 family predicted phage terminase small subunit
VWAKDVDDEAAEVVGALFAVELVERYPAMALVAAQAWVRRRRALADIEERGMVLTDKDGNAKPHPLLPVVSACERTLLDLSKRFGLDPRSEVELVCAFVDADRVADGLEELRAAGRAAWVREVDAAEGAA